MEQRDVISRKRRDADLAALAVCTLFDFAQFHATQHIQMELIASHMRIVWSMNKRREYVISGYPSEPILAIAALHHLHEVNRLGERLQTLSFMRDAVIEHHIAKGEKGELVARLILILAMYKALNLPDTSGHLEPIPSVDVRDFLQALLPDGDHVDKFWASSPCRGGVSGAPTVDKIYQNAKIYFTHFVRYAITPEAKHLWAAVVRGQAIQCSFQQEEVDIIIPVVLDAQAKLAEKHMSAILIQVRNRTSLATWQPVAKKIGLFGEELTPYISIVFQLGLPKPAGKEINTPSPHTANNQAMLAVCLPPAPLRASERKAKNEGGQYCINIQGCFSKSFGAICKEEEELFQQMLDSQDIVASHPRQNEDCIKAVAALKPYWGDREGTFDWTDFE